ncbi:MAG: zinc finger domain-containing protein [Candidatus Woesearchaeota archaeon]
MEGENRCVSTGQNISNDYGSVRFKCPNCGEGDIIRSHQARMLASKYRCEMCGFEGPN